MKRVNKIHVNILVLLMGIIFFGCNSEGNNFETNTNTNNVTTTVAVISTEFKETYLLELNRVRTVQQSCGSEGIYAGTIGLTWSNRLYQAAYEHSYDLSTTNTFSHTGSGQVSDKTGIALGKSSTFEERIAAYGYRHSQIGENIGAGTNTDTAKKIIAQLMASDGHCTNIMNPNYKEIGMAMSKNSNSKYVHYWTQNFGRAR